MGARFRRELAEGMRWTGRNSMRGDRSCFAQLNRNNGFACSPTLTPTAARARKGARRWGASKKLGARPMEGRASTTTAAMPRKQQCLAQVWGLGWLLADRIRFPGDGRYGTGYNLVVRSRRARARAAGTLRPAKGCHLPSGNKYGS